MDAHSFSKQAEKVQTATVHKENNGYHFFVTSIVDRLMEQGPTITNKVYCVHAHELYVICEEHSNQMKTNGVVLIYDNA